MAWLSEARDEVPRDEASRSAPNAVAYVVRG
jgi:hypothetical protein